MQLFAINTNAIHWGTECEVDGVARHRYSPCAAASLNRNDGVWTNFAAYEYIRPIQKVLLLLLLLLTFLLQQNKTREYGEGMGKSMASTFATTHNHPPSEIHTFIHVKQEFSSFAFIIVFSSLLRLQPPFAIEWMEYGRQARIA